MPRELLAFAGLVVVMAALPGPDMALAVRNGIAAGSRAAALTGIGFVIGLLIWATATVLGLAALVAAVPAAFRAVQVAGALYLAWLGVGSLLDAARGTDTSRLSLGAAPAEPARGGGYLRQGLVSNLLNPKIALLFLTLLPQFVAAGEPRTRTTAELAATLVGISLVWWLVFALAVGALSRILSRPAVRRGVEVLVGVVLIALAIRVALSV
jgi:threonine/homoserine/homoserine lactone efflux protein